LSIIVVENVRKKKFTFSWASVELREAPDSKPPVKKETEVKEEVKTPGTSEGQIELKDDSGESESGPKKIKANHSAPKITVPKFLNLPKETEFDMENIFSNVNLLKLIVKWRLHILIVTLFAIAMAMLFSSPWFIKPKYKSTAVIYPSNLIPYSSETPTELMLQIFQSDDIRDSLIKKFDLAEHYDVDITDNLSYLHLIKELEGNLDIRKTEYESVIVEILDTDPFMACKMVKEMMNQFNIKVRNLYRDKAKEILIISEKQMKLKQEQVDTLQKELYDLRMNYGIIDYKVQAKEALKAYFKSLSGKGSGNYNTINSSIENLKLKGGDFVLANDLYYAAIVNYNKLKEEYESALKDVTKELTYINYVSNPVPALKKSYPIRWLIVLISAVAAFALSLTTIIVIESIRTKAKSNNQPGAWQT
jgi:capsular polysaccharide biosynthesis protein